MNEAFETFEAFAAFAAFAAFEVSAYVRSPDILGR